MDHRDGGAPVTLAGQAPVAQPVVDLDLALRLAADGTPGKMRGRGLLGVVDGEAVEEAGIEDGAGISVGLVAYREAVGIGAGGQDDGDDGQVIFAGEIEVALVMRRAAEMAPVPYSISTKLAT